MIPTYKVPYGLSQDETTERTNRAMDDMYSKIGGVWTFKKDFDYYAGQKDNPIQITSTDWQEVAFYNAQIETPKLSALIVNLNIPISTGTGLAKIRLNVDEQVICCLSFLSTSDIIILNGLAVNLGKGKHNIKVYAIVNSGTLTMPVISLANIDMTKAPYVFANLWCVGFM